jgi:hypothetical protein
MLDKLNKFGMLSAFIIGAWVVGFLMGGRSFETYDPHLRKLMSQAVRAGLALKVTTQNEIGLLEEAHSEFWHRYIEDTENRRIAAGRCSSLNTSRPTRETFWTLSGTQSGPRPRRP